DRASARRPTPPRAARARDTSGSARRSRTPPACRAPGARAARGRRRLRRRPRSAPRPRRDRRTRAPRSAAQTPLRVVLERPADQVALEVVVEPFGGHVLEKAAGGRVVEVV